MEQYWKLKRGSARSHSGEESLWKKLWICVMVRSKPAAGVTGCKLLQTCFVVTCFGPPVFPLVELCLVCQSKRIHTTLESACHSLLTKVMPTCIYNAKQFISTVCTRTIYLIYSFHLWPNNAYHTPDLNSSHFVLWLLLSRCFNKTNSHTHTAVLVLLLSCIISTMVRSHLMHCWKMPLNSVENLEVLKYAKAETFWWLSSRCRQTTYCMSEYRAHIDIDRKQSQIISPLCVPPYTTIYIKITQLRITVYNMYVLTYTCSQKHNN